MRMPLPDGRFVKILANVVDGVTPFLVGMKVRTKSNLILEFEKDVMRKFQRIENDN